MTDRDAKKLRLLEDILDQMRVAVIYVNNEGTIEYFNRMAAEMPSTVPLKIGSNIRNCHNAESNVHIAHIFEDFKNGRREPHYYVEHVSQSSEAKDLVTMIPLFESESFVGCLETIHTVEIKGPDQSF